MTATQPATSIANKPTKLMANSIRALSMDAVQKANSGHPGMPMGMAEIAVALWGDQQDGLKHNPQNPQWFNRDRFVLSNGHGSMLLYSLLHLTGYDLSIDDIQQFRQFGSKTPGHPENHMTAGVETTTGPLGQGLANAVGMALSEKLLANQFNKEGLNIVDHHTYVFMGDGCLMEGISHEACALAGTLKLNKLICFWDDNGISIDGKVEGWFTDDTPARFRAYGWDVIEGVDGHDVAQINAALVKAKQNQNPTLICCKTVIGKGAPGLEGGDKVHGAPLGNEVIAKTRVAIGWDYEPFVIPEQSYAAWDAKQLGEQAEDKWNQLFKKYQTQFPQDASEFVRRMKGQLLSDFDQVLADYVESCNQKAETIATRKASQNAINGLAKGVPEFLGGSADLTGSNLTNWSGCEIVTAAGTGNYISYGVREFGMCAMTNGVALHGGYIPFSATFLTFSDYARNALRMAALMKLRNIFVFTHDSIGVGEDGPTHQPIEHTTALRIIPNMDVWRPCDTVETAVAWGAAVKRADGPTSLIFTRQNLVFQKRTPEQIAAIQKGGYILKANPNAVMQLIATGSEVDLAMKAADALLAQGVAVNVVSMPSTTVFDRQEAQYRNQVLPKGLPNIAIEAGETSIWWKYGCVDVIGMSGYGESAPANLLFEHFGFTVDNIVAKVKAALA